MKVIAVHAFRERSDAAPEAIFTVTAQDDAEALALVEADKASAFYDCFLTETYAEASVYPKSAIIAFEPVRHSRPVAGSAASPRLSAKD